KSSAATRTATVLPSFAWNTTGSPVVSTCLRSSTMRSLASDGEWRVTLGPPRAVAKGVSGAVPRASSKQDGVEVSWRQPLDGRSVSLYFCVCRNMEAEAGMAKRDATEVARYADMLSAMGTEPRLRIVRLLLSAHPEGMVVGDIGGELDIAPSTLSHHLEKLKNEDLVRVRREGTYLWYSANTEALEELLRFLYAE